MAKKIKDYNEFQEQAAFSLSIPELQEQQPLKFELLQKMIQKNRLMHAYLVVGEKGSGKSSFAYYLACAKYCEEKIDDLPCLVCSDCKRVLKKEHPDFQWIQKDGTMIKVDQIRAAMGILSRKSMENKGHFLVIEDAELMNVNSSNSLLKTLEEPAKDVQIVLLTRNISKILPTIQSRAQILQLGAVPKKVMLERLTSEKVPQSLAEDLVNLFPNVEVALQASQNENILQLRKEIQQFLKFLFEKNALGFVFVQKNLVKYWKGKDFTDEEKKENERIILELIVHDVGKKLKEVSQNGSSKQIEQALQMIENAQKMQVKKNSNVPLQVLLEQFAVKCI